MASFNRDQSIVTVTTKVSRVCVYGSAKVVTFRVSRAGDGSMPATVRQQRRRQPCDHSSASRSLRLPAGSCIHT